MLNILIQMLGNEETRKTHTYGMTLTASWTFIFYKTLELYLQTHAT